MNSLNSPFSRFFRTGLALITIALGSTDYSARAQGYHSRPSLPEPRYQEKERGGTRILNREYPYVILEDRWEQELERKVRELNSSNLGYDSASCDRLTLFPAGIHCEKKESYCARSVTKRTESNCISNKISDFSWQQRNCFMGKEVEEKEVCVDPRIRDIGLNVEYASIQMINRSDGFFNDDNVVITTPGKKYEIDFKSKEQAEVFAYRLEEIKQMAARMTYDSQSRPLREEADRLQAARAQVWSNLSYHQKMVHMALKCSTAAMDNYIYRRATKPESISTALRCIEKYAKGDRITLDLLDEAKLHSGKSQPSHQDVSDATGNLGGESQYQDISSEVLGFMDQDAKSRYFPSEPRAQEFIKVLRTSF